MIEAETQIDKALAVQGSTPPPSALDYLPVVVAAIRNADQKPVNCKLLKECDKLRQKLEAKIALDEAMNNENIIENSGIFLSRANEFVCTSSQRAPKIHLKFIIQS